MTRRLATDGARRSATSTTTREYASSASDSLGASCPGSRVIVLIFRTSELDGDRALVGAADQGQLEAALRSRAVERLVQRLDAIDLATGGRDDQVAALHARALGGAPVLDRAHQHAVAL